MDSENGKWILHGPDARDDGCLRSPEALLSLVDEIGFLPLFKNSVAGFSVEERTAPAAWWTGDERSDPWEWRRILADGGKAAYGKFFDRKAGFISLKWLPVFVNWRRDGYDFDSRWEDEKAPFRQKKIMDLFETDAEMYSFDVKRKAGFGPGGEKNFEGVITDLMMQTYLVIRDFRCRLNRKGAPYGWHVAVYAKPESVWGYGAVTADYRTAPAESRALVYDRMRRYFPDAKETDIRKILK